MCPGDNGSLSVITTPQSATYQWLRNGSPVIGQTKAQLNIVNATTNDDSTSTAVPSIFLTPTWVTIDNMKSTVIKDAAVKASDLCVSAVAAACTAAGIG